MIKISIIMPVHNTEKHLFEKAIDSVLKLEHFKKKRVELIIIDDYSTNFIELKKIIPKYENIIFIRNKKNLGASLSRQRGIDLARGEYISFLDSDDYLKSDYNKIFTLLGANDLYIKKNKYYSYWITNSIFVKRNFIVNNNIKYNNKSNIYNNFYEDLHFLTKCILLAKKIEYFNIDHYFYNKELCKNTKSISSRIEKLYARYFQVISAFREAGLKNNKNLKILASVFKYNKMLTFSSINKCLKKFNDGVSFINDIKKYKIPKLYYRPWNIIYYIKSNIIRKIYG